MRTCSSILLVLCGMLLVGSADAAQASECKQVVKAQRTYTKAERAVSKLRTQLARAESNGSKTLARAQKALDNAVADEARMRNRYEGVTEACSVTPRPKEVWFDGRLVYCKTEEELESTLQANIERAVNRVTQADLRLKRAENKVQSGLERLSSRLAAATASATKAQEKVTELEAASPQCAESAAS